MERKDRRHASKILVKSAKSKIPQDFASFLSNNDNNKNDWFDFWNNYKRKTKTKVFTYSANKWSLSIQLQQMYSDHFVYNNRCKWFM